MTTDLGRPERVVIAGGSMAALRTAEALRSAKFNGEIVVVGEDPLMPYNRPPLSKQALREGPAHPKLAFRTKASVADVVWRLGERVAAADLTHRTVTLDDGTTLEYDALVAATGVRPRRLPVPGPVDGRYVIRTIDDAASLHGMLAAGRHMVVLGAGFIGCEVAATARSLGCQVTVVAVDEEPMLRPLGPLVGAAIRERHERQGVSFMLGRSVIAFLGAPSVTAIGLDDGTVIEADVIVEAVGTLCNTEWLEGNGLDLSNGVVTDGALRAVGADRLYAVGDVARYPNPLFDECSRRIEHWQLVSETARTAAKAIVADLGGTTRPAPFESVPYFWTDQYDLSLQSLGAPGLADRVEVIEGSLNDECAVGYFRGDALVGVVLLGMKSQLVRFRKEVLEALRQSPTALSRS